MLLGCLALAALAALLLLLTLLNPPLSRPLAAKLLNASRYQTPLAAEARASYDFICMDLNFYVVKQS